MAKVHKLRAHSRAKANHSVVKPVQKTVKAPANAPKKTGHGRGKKTFVQYG